MQGNVFSTKTFALMFSYISHIFSKFTISLKCLLSFYARVDVANKSCGFIFAGFKKQGKYNGISKFSLFLGPEHFGISNSDASRQQTEAVQYNNLSDHFIDQILKMFIYLTLGRENLARGIRFSK